MGRTDRVGARPWRAASLCGERKALWGNAPMCLQRGIYEGTIMSEVDDKFRKVRIDQSPYLFHFTRGSIQDAKNTMYSILDQEKLISNTGRICFTASPITAILDFFKTTVRATGDPMYQPFGIGFSRDLLIKDYGARNVIYGSSNEMDDIPDSLKWRSLRLDVGEYDFEYLREWRIKGSVFDFSKFPKEHILIVAPTPADLNDLIVKHDVALYPVLNCYGEYEPEMEEVFIRGYKGMSIEEIATHETDYAVSGSTASQQIGEDMYKSLLASHFFVSGSTSSNT